MAKIDDIEETADQAHALARAAKSQIDHTDARVEEHAAALKTVQSTVGQLKSDVEKLASDAEAGVKSALVSSLEELDATLRREGLSLLQVIATNVKNITGHDVKVEQTSDQPKA